MERAARIPQLFGDVAAEFPAGVGDSGELSGGKGGQEGAGRETAVTTWSAVHGLIALLLEGQLPHSVLEQFSIRQMLIFSLNQLCRPGFSFAELTPAVRI